MLVIIQCWKVYYIVIRSVVLSQEVHTALLGADGEDENEDGSEEGEEVEEEEEKESIDENPTPGKGFCPRILRGHFAPKSHAIGM